MSETWSEFPGIVGVCGDFGSCGVSGICGVSGAAGAVVFSVSELDVDGCMFKESESSSVTSFPESSYLFSRSSSSS